MQELKRVAVSPEMCKRTSETDRFYCTSSDYLALYKNRSNAVTTNSKKIQSPNFITLPIFGLKLFRSNKPEGDYSKCSVRTASGSQIDSSTGISCSILSEPEVGIAQVKCNFSQQKPSNHVMWNEQPSTNSSIVPSGESAQSGDHLRCNALFPHVPSLNSLPLCKSLSHLSSRSALLSFPTDSEFKG